MAFLGSFRSRHLGWVYNPQAALYHGTDRAFPTLKLNQNKILWLTPNRMAAEVYSAKSWSRDTPTLWKVFLKPTARIIDLADLSNPVVQKLKEELNQDARRLFPLTEENWASRADFGLLEANAWVRGWLKAKKYDGATVIDKASTTDVRHDSVALFSLSAIESAQQIQPSGLVTKKTTIGEMERLIQDWRPSVSDFR